MARNQKNTAKLVTRAEIEVETSGVGVEHAVEANWYQKPEQFHWPRSTNKSIDYYNKLLFINYLFNINYISS